jgi:short-subunit dehydrogenase
LRSLQLALVTGAGRGIGLAISEALLAEGCRVVMTDIDVEALESSAKGLDPTGERVMVLPLDVTDGQAFHRVIETVQSQWGPVDLLVNNAGIMVLGQVLEVPLSLDERQIDINIRGVLNGQRAVLPSMLRRGRGHVVNIASAAGQVGIPYAAVYSATKFAVVGLTEAVAYETRDTGVFFTAVCPSLVETELLSGADRPRWPPAAQPQDVAQAVVRAVKKRKELVFVPRLARLTAILPAVLPRRVARRIAEFLNMGEMFHDVDMDQRAAYRGRMKPS